MREQHAARSAPLLDAVAGRIVAKVAVAQPLAGTSTIEQVSYSPRLTKGSCRGIAKSGKSARGGLYRPGLARSAGRFNILQRNEYVRPKFLVEIGTGLVAVFRVKVLMHPGLIRIFLPDNSYVFAQFFSHFSPHQYGAKHAPLLQNPPITVSFPFSNAFS